jgi:hypothetical protein
MQNQNNSEAQNNTRVPFLKFIVILTAIVSLDLAALYILFFLMHRNLTQFIEQIVRL